MPPPSLMSKEKWTYVWCPNFAPNCPGRLSLESVSLKRFTSLQGLKLKIKEEILNICPEVSRPNTIRKLYAPDSTNLFMPPQYGYHKGQRGGKS